MGFVRCCRAGAAHDIARTNRLTVGDDARTLRCDLDIRWLWQSDRVSDRSVEHIEMRTAAAQIYQIPVGRRANTIPLRAKVMLG